MNQLEQLVETIRNTHWLLAPLIYLIIHVIRPIFFIPVVIIFIAGGLIFGIIPGIILSIIGVSLSSAGFYLLTKLMPSITNRLVRMKGRLFGRDVQMTLAQIAVVRLLPFVHYHLLSFLIYESTKNFKAYMYASFVSAIPMAVVYTIIGQSITEFSPMGFIVLTLLLLPLFYFFRDREQSNWLRHFMR